MVAIGLDTIQTGWKKYMETQTAILMWLIFLRPLELTQIGCNAMTEEEQRIAIAEAYGWSWHNRSPRYGRQSVKSWYYKNTNRVVFNDGDLPDYLNDLNAIHDAEKVLTSLVQQQTYISRLRQLTDPQSPDAYSQGFLTAHATAAQRAEALLRTIGKWKD